MDTCVTRMPATNRADLYDILDTSCPNWRHSWLIKKLRRSFWLGRQILWGLHPEALPGTALQTRQPQPRTDVHPFVSTHSIQPGNQACCVVLY